MFALRSRRQSGALPKMALMPEFMQDRKGKHSKIAAVFRLTHAGRLGRLVAFLDEAIEDRSLPPAESDNSSSRWVLRHIVALRRAPPVPASRTHQTRERPTSLGAAFTDWPLAMDRQPAAMWTQCWQKPPTGAELAEAFGSGGEFLSSYCVVDRRSFGPGWPWMELPNGWTEFSTRWRGASNATVPVRSLSRTEAANQVAMVAAELGIA